MSKYYKNDPDGGKMVETPSTMDLDDKLDRVTEEIQNSLESTMTNTAGHELVLGEMGKDIGCAIEHLQELNAKVVNLANKLEEHLKERDAHNPAMMR